MGATHHLLPLPFPHLGFKKEEGTGAEEEVGGGEESVGLECHSCPTPFPSLFLSIPLFLVKSRKQQEDSHKSRKGSDLAKLCLSAATHLKHDI